MVDCPCTAVVLDLLCTAVEVVDFSRMAALMEKYCAQPVETLLHVLLLLDALHNALVVVVVETSDSYGAVYTVVFYWLYKFYP